MSADVIFAIALLLGINNVTIYFVVKLLVTGKAPLFERKGEGGK